VSEQEQENEQENEHEHEREQENAKEHRTSWLTIIRNSKRIANTGGANEF
jgi:hypothetical protein